MQKMRSGDQFQLSFCYFKKDLFEVKASRLQLIYDIYGSQLGTQK